MKARHLRLVVMLSALAVVISAAAYAKKAKEATDETERVVSADQLPSAALKALKKRARGAEIAEFAEEIEHGSTFYEGSWKARSGRNTDVLVTKAGDLVEIEEQIPADKAPAAVLKAARKAAGKGTKLIIEKKTMILYEIKFGGEEDEGGHELLLTPDGRVQEEEKGRPTGDDEDEDEDEEEVSINEVPKAVRATILKHARDGEVGEITKEEEDGKVVYEAEIEVGDKEYELEIAANGKLLKKESDEDNDDDKDGDHEDDDDDV